MDKHTKVDGREIVLTNLDKVFWPNVGITKGELIAYYNEVSSYLLPHLLDRPEALNRFPNGIAGENFFQKNTQNTPAWLQIYQETGGNDNHEIHYPVCKDRASLLYLINLGCIDLNVWSSRTDSPDNPDFVIFDLDPVDIGFKEVATAALLIRDTLDKLGIASYPKTSGKRGLHIYIPIVPVYSFDQTRDFAHLVAMYVHDKLPKTTSLARQPKDRKGKVYLDYLQNRKGATMAAPYCVRPVLAATVSTPLTWKEVQEGVEPSNFTIHNIPERLKRLGDIFTPTLARGLRLEDAIAKLDFL